MSEISFSANIIEQQYDTPKSTQGIYELPSGYIDAAGVLHSEIHVREMTGREEDLLASSKMAVGKKINSLLSACTIRIGTIIDKAQIAAIIPQLTQGDRIFLLLALRRTTLGDEYPVEEVCPECSAKSFHILNLGDLDIKQLPDRMVRAWDIPLPSGRTARVRIALGSDEDKVSKVAEEDRPSAMLLTRTELLDNRPPSVADLQGLSWRDRGALRAAMEEYTEGVDSTLEITCPSCQHEFKRDMDMGAEGFFFPERAQKALSRKYST